MEPDSDREEEGKKLKGVQSEMNKGLLGSGIFKEQTLHHARQKINMEVCGQRLEN